MVANEMVSVITPMYNCEKYINETIESILSQTYPNFEVLCIDDLSTDNTAQIIKGYSEIDERVKYFKLPDKGGASMARNLALGVAKGRYIAFLDADDIWEPKKLEEQIKFMIQNKYVFSYTDYDLIDEYGNKKSNFKRKYNKVSHKTLLKRNSIGCLTVIYDKTYIGIIQIPRLDKRNDYALWLKVLKRTKYGYRYPVVLSSYRITNGSLSNSGSKISLIKYHFKLFRIIEKYSVLKSAYYSFRNMAYYTLDLIYEKFAVYNNRRQIN